YDSAPKRPPEIPGLIDSELTGTEWVCTCRVSGDQEQYSFARNTGAQIVETSILSLEEIFVINSKSRN
ncbi:MAG: hypothetical protein MUC83_17210, partial [Pirellula sp.]|nr:hypothetical protein [Pirellula sp.]